MIIVIGELWELSEKIQVKRPSAELVSLIKVVNIFITDNTNYIIFLLTSIFFKPL